MDLSNYSLEELQELRTELNEQIKALRKEEMEELDNQNREALSQVEAGDLVRVIYKDKETEVTFVKATEKRMVVEIEGRKVALPFRKFLG